VEHGRPVVVYVALGANIDEPQQHIARALRELGALPETRLVAVSSLYRSAPWGYQDQPDFYNAVARIETTLEPETLLDQLLEIERRHGRARAFRNSPRPLDLDIIVYGDRELRGERLIIPHPRLQERAFVLTPLVEIAPELQVPGLGAVALLHGHVADPSLTRVADAGWQDGEQGAAS
jgi:2-amino-4-hydroxy-6-hydroxymethyldihydropteridine diphosphokinase